jgi:hypothetical protein
MLTLRLRTVFLLFLSVLFPIGASVPIACCAGAVDTHGSVISPTHHCGGGGGGSCCDRAAEDAQARHCCNGGDAFERTRFEQQTPLALAPIGPPAPISAPALRGDVPAAPLDPVPKLEPLYTLHSSLLI